MSREIDLLVEAAGASYLVVEKATNVLWTLEELHEAGAAGQYQVEDRITSAEDERAVSGPFPGCLQQLGQPEEWSRHRLLGQTRHFLLFAGPTEPGCA
jgi:hypothetical protein